MNNQVDSTTSEGKRGGNALGEPEVNKSTETNLAVRFNAQLHNLRGIVAIAPYLGLAGTTIGIMDGLGYGVATGLASRT